ncbi:MAG: hypothetical protein CMA53_01430 [Euryarchaeota archaeon]|nr:hypothetical protein [Euryarchaeota archaeon]|tara:strand:+ start:4830 stop:5024 length:195 start_codon:yes stop_codon:yes gene_type:complete
MAKFGRYDPRNKKRDRNKNQSQNKDIRIREVEEKSRFNSKSNSINYALLDGIDEFDDEDKDLNL